MSTINKIFFVKTNQYTVKPVKKVRSQFPAFPASKAKKFLRMQ